MPPTKIRSLVLHYMSDLSHKQNITTKVKELGKIVEKCIFIDKTNTTTAI